MAAVVGSAARTKSGKRTHTPSAEDSGRSSLKSKAAGVVPGKILIAFCYRRGSLFDEDDDEGVGVLFCVGFGIVFRGRTDDDIGVARVRRREKERERAPTRSPSSRQRAT